MEERLFDGLRGCPFALTLVETVMRDPDGMWTEMCGFVSAHLPAIKSVYAMILVKS